MTVLTAADDLQESIDQAFEDLDWVLDHGWSWDELGRKLARLQLDLEALRDESPAGPVRELTDLVVAGLVDAQAHARGKDGPALGRSLREVRGDLVSLQDEVLALAFDDDPLIPDERDPAMPRTLPSTRAALQGKPPTNGTNGHAANGKATPSPAGVRTDAPPDPGRYEPAMPIDQIAPSRTNPRKTFDEAALDELAASIREKGVLLPVLVRRRKLIDRVGKHKEEYELVAGERRWRAAKRAGLATIPATVRELDDRAALEVQIIENLQREDLDPLEEAAGFQVLKVNGYSAEDLAAKVGKQKGYVYGSLKLLHLPEAARDALAERRISVSVAQLIGRIPGEKTRVEATKRILAGGEHFARPGGGWCRVETGPMNVKDACDFVEATYMRQLKGAPFDRKSLDLVPVAGSCEDCPKLTGNNREEYPEGRADVCTDPSCYAAKVAAHGARKLEAYRSKPGYKVLEGKAADKFQSWQHTNLDNHCYEDAKNRKYRTLLKEAIAAGKVEVLVRVNPGTEEVEEFVGSDAARKHVRGTIERRPSYRGGAGASKKDKELADLYADARAELMARAAQAVETRLARDDGPDAEFLVGQLIGAVVVEHWQYDDEARLAINRRRPAEKESKSRGRDGHGPALAQLLQGLDLGGRAGLLAELLAALFAPSRHDRENHREPEAAAFFAAVGLDPGQVLEEVKAKQPKAKGAKP